MSVKANGGLGSLNYVPSVGRIIAVMTAALFISGCVSQRALEEPEAKLHIQNTPKYEKSADGGTQLARQKKNEAIDLSTKAIVVMRGELLAPSDFEYKAISINFSTQDIDSLNSGRDSSTDRIAYLSATNSFYAVLVEPGTYRYAWNELGNPAWIISRYSPTKLIEFTVEAGEALYVGDLKVILPEVSVYRQDTLLGGKGAKIAPGFTDYRFKVKQDENAARQFYEGLAIDDKPPLQVRPMSNNPMPRIRRYSNPKCNGLWYIAYTSRGIC
ncbi:hypothetical protein [Pelagibius sp. Alg239-R121]|uniref:hypothetical protein n=1 Tax=Pelagibius sp. Alg239-R121 TaxID=2993448 RepID=UPI0024A63F56|nr:hypothetical protein [Pelagibius sp. Alg239-R121]